MAGPALCQLLYRSLRVRVTLPLTVIYSSHSEPGRALLNNTVVTTVAIRYDTRCYSNVSSKADMSQLCLLHGTNS